jgi:hypothetical protein
MTNNHVTGSIVRRIVYVTLFAIAMGFLESAVVIYLREIMYPEGFQFPLAPVHPHLALTELLREAATLVMLLCVGLLAGRSFSERFAWFIYSFAIWDIFYYLFLWILIGWPSSLMTWDVLFLIPFTWTGPVITPLFLTVIMIALSVAILYFAEKGNDTTLHIMEWSGLIVGSLVVIWAFTLDYMNHMLSRFSLGEIVALNNPSVMEHARNYIPIHFPWLIYFTGSAILIATIFIFITRMKRINH